MPHTDLSVTVSDYESRSTYVFHEERENTPPSAVPPARPTVPSRRHGPAVLLPKTTPVAHDDDTLFRALLVCSEKKKHAKPTTKQKKKLNEHDFSDYFRFERRVDGAPRFSGVTSSKLKKPIRTERVVMIASINNNIIIRYY